MFYWLFRKERKELYNMSTTIQELNTEIAALADQVTNLATKLQQLIAQVPPAPDFTAQTNTVSQITATAQAANTLVENALAAQAAAPAPAQ